MNIYFKNYGIYLGGALLFSFLLGFAGIYFPFSSTILLLAGTIVGTVMLHKDLGSNIQFGKAIGPMLLIIGAYHVLGLVISIIQWGMIDLGFMLPYFISELFFSCFIGTMVLLMAGVFYMYEKAGHPGWAAIVPIYNIIILIEIAQKPTWWIAMIFIPIANIVFLVMIFDGVSKNFGKDSGFTVGLVLLGQVFQAVLGYGDAQYLGNKPNMANDQVIDDLLE